jgi:hypothetical protein
MVIKGHIPLDVLAKPFVKFAGDAGLNDTILKIYLALNSHVN